jgi:hypothetical protein
MGKATPGEGPTYLKKLHIGANEERDLMGPPRHSNSAKRDPIHAYNKGLTHGQF